MYYENDSRARNTSQRNTETGMRTLQYVPGSMYNANRAAAFYEILSHARNTSQRNWDARTSARARINV